MAYCKLLTTPEYKLTVDKDKEIQLQFCLCVLYLRKLSVTGRMIVATSNFYGGDSIYPRFGHLGRALIDNEHINLVVTLEEYSSEKLKKNQDEYIKTLEIRNFAEFNTQGCSFLNPGNIPAGKIYDFSDRYMIVEGLN